VPAARADGAARPRARAKRLRRGEPELGRGRQVVRLLKLQSAIERAPGGLTVAELSGAIGERCSRRTLYRDLEHLQAAGVPLRSDAGKWQLESNGAAKNGRNGLPFAVEELLALRLAEQLLAPLGGAWLGRPLCSVSSKVAASLPPAARALCEELARAEVATLAVPGHYRHRSNTLESIDEAIQKQHALAIDYAAPGKPFARRVVEPYAVWFASGRVYLLAHCRTAGAVRTFAVARIQGAEVLDEAFDPPPEFDAGDYVSRAFGVFQGATHEVVIDFSAEVAHVPRERRLHPTQSLQPLAGGEVRLRMSAAGLPEIAAWIAGFGGKARPVAPPELRERVERIHRAGLEVSSGVTRAGEKGDR
jgi:predicted DNA-binding transcriptional regulator YafY